MCAVEKPRLFNISIQQFQGPVSSNGAVQKLSESRESLVQLKSTRIYSFCINLAFFSGNIFVNLHLFMWILLRPHCFVSYKMHKCRRTKHFPVDVSNAIFTFIIKIFLFTIHLLWKVTQSHNFLGQHLRRCETKQHGITVSKGSTWIGWDSQIQFNCKMLNWRTNYDIRVIN